MFSGIIIVEFHENEVRVLIVCFIGHRDIDNAEQIKTQLKEIVTNLIQNGADTFLFGSRSYFNYICWSVVTELQSQFSNLRRIKFNASHEVAFTSKKDKEQYEKLFSKFAHKETNFENYEEAIDCEKSFQAHKNAYIMRNQEMIDRSDICVFYYDKNYLPPKRKQSQKNVFAYQPKSGTAIALAYATQKKKQIINLFSN